MPFLDRTEEECQPCEKFETYLVSVLGYGPQPHECPLCGGTRYFCANCNTDHHEGGWNICKHKYILRGRFATSVCPRKHPACEAAHASNKEEQNGTR